jgi:Sel1 repeat
MGTNFIKFIFLKSNCQILFRFVFLQVFFSLPFICQSKNNIRKQQLQKADTSFWHEQIPIYLKYAKYLNGDQAQELSSYFISEAGHNISYSIYWNRLASNAGSILAQCNRGYAYSSGTGEIKNIDSARFWYCKAAQSKDAFANLLYGSKCVDGELGFVNFDTGIYYLQKAVALNDATACFYLANIFKSNKILNQNTDSSNYYFDKYFSLHKKSFSINITDSIAIRTGNKIMCINDEGISDFFIEIQIQPFLQKMKSNSTLKLLIIGNGTTYVGQNLSWFRCLHIYNYLYEKHKISRSRMVFEYGQEGISNSVDLEFIKSENSDFFIPPPPHPRMREFYPYGYYTHQG